MASQRPFLSGESRYADQAAHFGFRLEVAAIGLAQVREDESRTTGQRAGQRCSAAAFQYGGSLDVSPGRPRECTRPYGAGSRSQFSLRGDGLEASRLLERFPALLEATLRHGRENGSLQLVWPDFYLATAAQAGRAHRIAEYLKAFAGH